MFKSSGQSKDSEQTPMAWTKTHYRDRLVEADLADSHLLQQSHSALDELTRIPDLGSVYDFQF